MAMNGFSTGEEDSRGAADQICCLVDENVRCTRPAGNASYSKRIQKTVTQRRLKLNLDNLVSHSIAPCVFLRVDAACPFVYSSYDFQACALGTVSLRAKTTRDLARAPWRFYSKFCLFSKGSVASTRLRNRIVRFAFTICGILFCYRRGIYTFAIIINKLFSVHVPSNNSRGGGKTPRKILEKRTMIFPRSICINCRSAR